MSEEKEVVTLNNKNEIETEQDFDLKLAHPFEESKFTITFENEEEHYAKIVCEPLERGFGLTLGNAMRRVLLSLRSWLRVTIMPRPTRSLRLFWMLWDGKARNAPTLRMARLCGN